MKSWSKVAIVAAAVLLLRHSGPAQLADADRDGIPDDWERNGVSLNYPDGSTHLLDLKALNASPGHKDIIVWVDWMGDETLVEGGKNVVHNHQPLDSSIEIVKNAFAGAKQFTDNPDGTTGINLIVLVSPTAVPHQDLLGTGDLKDGSVWTALAAIRDQRMPAQLKGVAHYCLFAHDIAPDGTSGISYDIGAYDFVVSLGQWQDHRGNETEQAGTFMHELGHNLGLRHGGMDDLNYKPNYLSIMNYFFQTDGLATPTGDGNINYSTVAFPDLDEGNLDENKPITTDAQWASWGSAYFCPNDKGHSIPLPSIYGTLVDWNCDGKLDSGIQADPNGDDNPLSGGINLLRSQMDWTQIRFMYPVPATGAPTGLNMTAELTVGGANATPLPPVRGLTALARDTTVRLSWNRVASSRVRGYEVMRISPSEPTIVFVTTDLTYVDRLTKPVPQVRYDVLTLFVPHGAADLVQATGKKLAGLDALAVGKTAQNVSVRLADKMASQKLQQAYTEDFKGLAKMVTAAGGNRPVVMAGLASELQGLRTLLSSQPATVEVKLQ
jgi:hypothetical protein